MGRSLSHVRARAAIVETPLVRTNDILMMVVNIYCFIKNEQKALNAQEGGGGEGSNTTSKRILEGAGILWGDRSVAIHQLSLQFARIPFSIFVLTHPIWTYHRGAFYSAVKMHVF